MKLDYLLAKLGWISSSCSWHRILHSPKGLGVHETGGTPPYDFRRLSDYVSSATSSQRFTTQLATVFSFNALLLAAIGIYGVVSYSVRQRLREVGIRLSLGARPFQIQALLTRSVLQWSVLGLGLGLGLSFLSGSVLEELLFGISPIDFPTYLLAGLILIGVGLAASWMPTRKALRISLIEILRTE